MTDELSKLDLFIKVMRMTDNDNDSQALVALHKANAMLKAEGWDWDRLLRSKIKIISNPFTMSAAPTARPASRAAAPPQSAPPPPTPTATNPWPGGMRPKAATRPSTPSYGANPPPPRQTAPVGPIHFRKSTSGSWCIAFHMALTTGDMVQISKKDGSSTTEQVGLYVERAQSGHYLYSINKASKWKNRYAGGSPTINDLL